MEWKGLKSSTMLDCDRLDALPLLFKKCECCVMTGVHKQRRCDQ